MKKKKERMKVREQKLVSLCNVVRSLSVAGSFGSVLVCVCVVCVQGFLHSLGLVKVSFFYFFWGEFCHGALSNHVANGFFLFSI